MRPSDGRPASSTLHERDGLGDAVFKMGPRPPTEDLSRETGVECIPTQVAWPRWPLCWLSGESRDLGYESVQAVDRRLQPGSHVHQAPIAMLGCEGERMYRVVHEHVVARLVPIPEDRGRLAPEHPLAEDGYDPRL